MLKYTSFFAVLIVVLITADGPADAPGQEPKKDPPKVAKAVPPKTAPAKAAPKKKPPRKKVKADPPFFRVPEKVEAKVEDGFAYIVVETNLPDDPNTIEDDVIVKARKTLRERIPILEVKAGHPDGQLKETATRTWVVSTAAPGEYLVEFNLPIRRAPECLVVITGKAPQPPPDGDEGADDGKDDKQPDEGDDPPPAADVAGVVVIADATDLEAADLQLGETWINIKKYVKTARWFAPGAKGSEPYVDAAKAVGLPAVLLFNDKGNLIRTVKLPATDAAFKELVD